jgi:membrane-associated phospholipid phosphatase
VTRLRRALSPRLALALGAFTCAAVPVTVLAFASTHGWAPVHSVDAGTASRLHAWAADKPGVVRFLQGVSRVLHPQVLRVASAVITGLLLLRRQRRLAAWVAVTMVAAGVLGDGLKTLVARARPQLPDAVASAPGYSFPSGHALNSFVFFAVLVLLLTPLLTRRQRIVAWVVAVLLILLVGFSRVALGVHYVSDVVAGWLVGAGLVGVTAAAFHSWRRTRGEPVGSVVSEGVDPEGVRAAVSHDPEPEDVHPVS